MNTAAPLLSGVIPGAKLIEGIGLGHVVPLWEPGLAHEISAVPAAEAMAMSRLSARDVGLFGGASSGANGVAALRLAERLGPQANIGTLMRDTSIKCLSTAVQQSSPVRRRIELPQKGQVSVPLLPT